MLRKTIIGSLILVVLIIAYSLLAQITDALKSSDRLSIQAEIVFKLEAKNRELKKKLTQIKSPEFIEQQARDKLGLSRNGETIVIIPEEKLKMVLGASSAAQEVRLPNWLGWLRVFFR
jgi:cell division protein FtsB